MQLETQTALENYETLKALVERRKDLEETDDQTAIQAVNELIDQFEGYPCYAVLVEEGE